MAKKFKQFFKAVNNPQTGEDWYQVVTSFRLNATAIPPEAATKLVKILAEKGWDVRPHKGSSSLNKSYTCTGPDDTLVIIEVYLTAWGKLVGVIDAYPSGVY